MMMRCALCVVRCAVCGVRLHSHLLEGPDLITYQVNWLKCARDYHQIDVDYLGLWNEMPWGSAEYVKGLKKAMKAENIATRLILGEQSKGGMPPVLE